MHDKLKSDQRVETYLSKSNKIPYFRSSLSFKIVHPPTLILTFAEQLCAKDKYFVYRKKIERREKKHSATIHDFHGWKGWKRKYTSESLIIHAWKMLSDPDPKKKKRNKK